MLQSNNVRVCPGEGHDGIAGGPDFLCSVSGQEFFVEATNIAKDKADTETGWLNAPRFMPLNKLVFEACDSKERQCRVRKAPVLLAIATFSESSMLAFSPPYPVQMITGRIEHTIHFSPGSATCVGETKSTELKHSAFLVFDTDGLVHIRAAIAGLILYGPTVGIVSGVLNPLATCPFRPDWIPSLQFETVEIDNVNLQMRLNPGNR